MCQIDALCTGSTFLRQSLFLPNLQENTSFHFILLVFKTLNPPVNKHIVPRNSHARPNEIVCGEKKNLIKMNLFFNKYPLIDEFQCFL